MEYQENPCRDLRDLLAGTLEASYFSDIEESRQHWQECKKCQTSFPDADAELKHIEDYALSQIRRNIGRLHQQYASEKPSILSPPEQLEEPTLMKPQVTVLDFSLASYKPPEPQEPHMRLLVLLAEKGETLRGQLEVMNDNWGLQLFRVAPDDGEYSSRVCGPLIASLAKEVQYFVFEAILAADVLNLFEGEFPRKFGETMLLVVERAAPEFLRRYLDEQKRLFPKARRNRNILSTPYDERIPVVRENIDRLKTDLEDVGDSLKAGQMEILRSLKPNSYQAAEIDEDLSNSLGKELFGKLSPETRQLLNRAECSFRRDRELGEFRPSILDFHRAYECEFRHRISGPLARKLVEIGHTDYPSVPDEPQLLVDRKFNGKLTLGEQLKFLWKDELLKNSVSSLGFDVKEIQRSASRLTKVRNDAAHDRPCSEKEGRDVRDLLLGTNSCLKALFPPSRFA